MAIIKHLHHHHHHHLHLLMLLCLTSMLLAPAWSDSDPPKTGPPEEDIRKRILANYSKTKRPNRDNKGLPVDVNVTMHILTFNSVNEHTMEFTTDFYFRQKWFDERLTYDHPSVSSIVGGAELASQLWKPDTFVSNARDVHHQTSVSSDQENIFVRIAPTGDVSYSTRIQVIASCAMNFKDYPADRQRCILEFESYAFSESDIVYQWGGRNTSISLAAHLQLAPYSLQGVKGVHKHVALSTGNYSRLAVVFQLQRSTGPYLTRAYLPAFTLVALSWLTFWLHPHRDRALRIALHVATVFGLIALYSQVDTPRVAYTTSLDAYFIISVLTVLAALKLTVMLAGFTADQPDRTPNRAEEEAMLGSSKSNTNDYNPEDGCGSKLTSSPASTPKGNSTNPLRCGYVGLLGGIRSHATKINTVARFAFPLVYILYNMAYFANLGK